MRVLVGQTGSAKMIERLKRLGWARLWTTHAPRPWQGEQWAFDSGIYADWAAGREWDEARFLHRVEQAAALGGPPYMAVTPDRVGEGLASLEFSVGWLERLPQSWPWFLALQDAMTVEDVELEIHRFAGLFVGGTNRFKATTPMWVELAHRHGKPCHYGRAGTPRKFQRAEAMGADSCDSSFPLWSYERFDWFANCALNGHPQRELSLEE